MWSHTVQVLQERALGCVWACLMTLAQHLRHAPAPCCSYLLENPTASPNLECKAETAAEQGRALLCPASCARQSCGPGLPGTIPSARAEGAPACSDPSVPAPGQLQAQGCSVALLPPQAGPSSGLQALTALPPALCNTCPGPGCCICIFLLLR